MGINEARLSILVRDSTAMGCVIFTTAVMHIPGQLPLVLYSGVQVRRHASLAVRKAVRKLNLKVLHQKLRE